MDSQDAPRGSSMFSGGRNQSFTDSKVSSIGRDLIILNWNGNGKQDKVPILLAPEAPTPRIDLLETAKGCIPTFRVTQPIKDIVTAAEPVTLQDVENPSIVDREQVNFLMSSLLKSLDQSSKQEQPHPGSLLDADQFVDSEVILEVQDKETNVSISKFYIMAQIVMYVLSYKSSKCEGQISSHRCRFRGGTCTKFRPLGPCCGFLFP